MKRCGNG